MRNEKILIVDDDPAIRRLIWKSLQSTGILIYQSDSVEKTLDIMTRISFDLFILDVALEHENDGYYLAEMIRAADPYVPIVFLSGKNKEEEIITGYEMGGDHYLTKPFSPKLLQTQIVSILSRNEIIRKTVKPVDQQEITQGAFRFDKGRYQFFKNGQLISLSSKETKLMQFFMENPNQVFSKEQIYRNVWESDDYNNNTIMVYINHLRNKIEENPQTARYLKTVWGLGYTFIPEGED